MASTLTKGDNS